MNSEMVSFVLSLVALVAKVGYAPCVGGTVQLTPVSMRYFAAV